MAQSSGSCGSSECILTKLSCISVLHCDHLAEHVTRQLRAAPGQFVDKCQSVGLTCELYRRSHSASSCGSCCKTSAAMAASTGRFCRDHGMK